MVFYYSGHGTKSPDRRNFLLPIDAKTGVDNARPLDRQAVSAEDIREKLKGIRARVTLLILDACRDGPGGGKSGSKGLARMGGGSQVLVAYATEEDRVAADGTGSNSPYAKALAQVLGRNDMPLLSQLDWVGDEVRKQVPGQEPTREGNLRADAYLATPFRKATPQEVVRIEDEAWALCRSGNTTAPCEDYLAGWPQGRYVALVKSKVRDLAQHAAGRRGEGPRAAVPRVFKDCDGCPEMVAIPGGSLMMGSPAGEPEREADEGPQRRVSIAPFAAGKTEVTFEQWDECVARGGCRQRPGDEGWGRGTRPVINVTWNEAHEYVKWLSAKTGKRYRLMSESEWEYAARGGTTTPFYTGDALTTEQANIDGNFSYNGSAKGVWRRRTTEVGGFSPNGYGLHDMHGNVWEWVQDCYEKDAYEGKAPRDGRAHEVVACTSRGIRGGSWFIKPANARSADRNNNGPDNRGNSIGFRLARKLP